MPSSKPDKNVSRHLRPLILGLEVNGLGELNVALAEEGQTENSILPQ